jgi:hypothetical protein
MLFILLLQAANTAANTAADTVAKTPSLEKRPALLSLIYLGGLAVMVLWLIMLSRLLGEIRGEEQRAVSAAQLQRPAQSSFE